MQQTQFDFFLFYRHSQQVYLCFKELNSISYILVKLETIQFVTTHITRNVKNTTGIKNKRKAKPEENSFTNDAKKSKEALLLMKTEVNRC